MIDPYKGQAEMRGGDSEAIEAPVVFADGAAVTRLDAAHQGEQLDHDASAPEVVDYGDFTVTSVDATTVPDDANFVEAHSDSSESSEEHSSSDFLSDHLAQATEYKAEQADAVTRGDYSGAEDAAKNFEGELHALSDHGADVNQELNQTTKDEVGLSYADYHQRIAKENEAGAAWYLTGDSVTQADADHAQSLAAQAGDHNATATDYALSANAGGHDADHTVTVEHSPDPEPPTD